MNDEHYMQRALELARRAASMDEVPVGCVVVREGAVIGEGFNLRETDEDPTAHAEIVAIREAARRRGSWHLDDAVLYVTCEPCPMCAGAAAQARIKRVVFGCRDPKGGGVTSHFGIGVGRELNHRFEVTEGVLADECAALLQEFFKNKR